MIFRLTNDAKNNKDEVHRPKMAAALAMSTLNSLEPVTNSRQDGIQTLPLEMNPKLQLRIVGPVD